MSKEHVLSFIQDAKANLDLQEKLKDINAQNTSSLIEIANKAGYDFSASEWDEYAKAAREEKSGKLCDDELDNVSGGGWLPTNIVPCQKQYNPLICGFLCNAFDPGTITCWHDYFD